MDQLKAFLNKYKISTHVLFGAWTALMTFYLTDAAAHKYINDTAVALYNLLPAPVEKFIVGFLIPFGVWYYNGHKAQIQQVVAAQQDNKTDKTDKTKESPSAGPQKLPALICCCLLLTASFTTTGCNADVGKIVSDVSVYTSEALPIVADVIQIISALGAFGSSSESDEYTAKVNGIEVQVQSDLQVLAGLCADYQAHKQGSTFKSIIAEVDSLVSNGDTALLDAAHIRNAATKQKVVLVLASASAILHTIDGIVQATQPKSVVQAKAKARAIKLRQVSVFWSDSDKEQIANAFHQPYSQVLADAVSAGF